MIHFSKNTLRTILLYKTVYKYLNRLIILIARISCVRNDEAAHELHAYQKLTNKGGDVLPRPCSPVLFFLFKEPSADCSVILPNQKISTN